MRVERYIEVNAAGVYEYTARAGLLPRAVTAVANTSRAVVRAAGLAAGMKLTAEAGWALVKENFPLGTAMNENTHIFDGCVYEGESGALFLMAALPLELAEEVTREVALYLGGDTASDERRITHFEKKIARVEILECLLFRRFCTAVDKQGVQWVVYPCEAGVKILTLARGAPVCVHFLPTPAAAQKDVADAALLRAWDEQPPVEIILLTRQDWGAEWFEARQWLEGFAAARGTAVRAEGF